MDIEVKAAVIRYLPALRRNAYVLTGNWAAADDLTQDCIERALRKSHLWRRRGSVKNWLFRIMYRQFLNSRRQKSAREDSLSIDHVDVRSPGTTMHQESRIMCLNVLDALFLLPQTQRAAVLLVMVEGYSYDETADLLDVPIGTIRSRLARARENLRPLLASEHRETRIRRVK